MDLAKFLKNVGFFEQRRTPQAASPRKGLASEPISLCRGVYEYLVSLWGSMLSAIVVGSRLGDGNLAHQPDGFRDLLEYEFVLFEQPNQRGHCSSGL
jgi:hypothetical protein